LFAAFCGSINLFQEIETKLLSVKPIGLLRRISDLDLMVSIPIWILSYQ